MRGTLTLFRRELRGYLQSPIAAIVVIAFLLLSAGLFMSQFFLMKMLDMRGFFGLAPLILAVVLPAVSMRLWAEDRQLNTLELLLSLPLKPMALVLGKFLAAAAFLTLMLGSTWTIPAMLRMLGKPDFGPIVSGYVGTLVLGMLFLGIGQFISGFCRDQIVAFILALFTCLGLFLIGIDFIAATVDGWWPGLGGFLQQTLGIAGHFASFEKGVVDSRDLIYFLLLVGVFLGLNGLWLEGRLRPRAKAAFATACALSLGIALAAQVVLRHAPLPRWDLTENRTYTVAPVTREFLRGLKVPVTVKLYLSPPEKMPTAMRTMERSLKDALEEIRLVSGGKLQYKLFHLEPSSAFGPAAGEEEQGKEGSLEKKLGRKGIQPFQVQSIEADELGVRLIYSAASIAYKDRPEEVIPQLVPGMLEQFEYLLISKIYRMTLEEPPQVAVVAPYQRRSMDPALMGLLQQMGMQAEEERVQDPYRYLPAILRQEGYPIRRIQLTEKEPIPPNTKALVIVEPGQMNDRQRYEIARFLVEGGSLFLAAQRYQFDYAQQGRGIVPVPKEQTIGVDPLLEHWGIPIRQEILLDEESRVISATTGATMGPFSVSVPVKSPVQIAVGQEQMNQNLSLTSQLSPLFYLWGSAIEPQESRLKELGLETTTLFTSSPRSWVASRSEYSILSPDRAPAGQRGGRFPLGVWLKGTFPDPYAGKPVPEWPKAEPTESQAATAAEPKKEAPAPISSLTSKPGQLILLGCSEMFKENLVESGGHLTFFLNAIDTLVSGGKLIGIRNKQQAVRGFPTPSGSKKAWVRFLTLGLMPILLFGAAITTAAWRRRLREAYAGL